MRAPPLVAVVLALAGSARADDLSSLLRGAGSAAPVPGPSPTVDEGPSKEEKVVLAAISELTGTNAATTLAQYRTSLAKRDAAGDERNPDQQDLDRAANRIRGLIRAKKIKISGISKHGDGDGFAGGWAYSFQTTSQGKDLEGEFKVGGLPAPAEYGERNVSRLLKLNQWANSTLHEVSHMLNTILVEFEGYQTKPLERPLPAPMAFKTKRFWNGITPLTACPAGQQCMFKRCDGDEDCVLWSFPKNHGQTTNEKAACELSNAVCTASSCEPYKRLIDAAR